MWSAIELIIAVWLAASLGYFARGWIGRLKMGRFDPNEPDHVMGLAKMVNDVLNSSHEGVRFALVVWRDADAELHGLVSNDLDDNHVVEMLDDAKKQIVANEGHVHQTVHGHA
jgi:hypothetical protein